MLCHGKFLSDVASTNDTIVLQLFEDSSLLVPKRRLKTALEYDRNATLRAFIYKTVIFREGFLDVRARLFVEESVNSTSGKARWRRGGIRKF